MLELDVPDCSVAHAMHLPSKIMFIEKCEVVSRQDNVFPEYSLLRVKIEDAESALFVKQASEKVMKEWFGIEEHQLPVATHSKESYELTVRATPNVLSRRVSTQSGAEMMGVPDGAITKMWISLSKGSYHTITDEYQSLMWDCMAIVMDF